jgi:hypothetical protein
MEKKKDYQFKLVEGQYTPLEAKKNSIRFINSKINFHQLENFSNEIRLLEECRSFKIRIELLTNLQKTDLISYSIQMTWSLK